MFLKNTFASHVTNVTCRLNKNAAGILRRLKVEVTLSAHRRDSRRLGVDEATHTDDERGFACAKFVDHVCDYT
jgi:hypothetical protein